MKTSLIGSFLLLVCFLATTSASEPFRFEERDADKQLALTEDDKPVLTYCFDMIEHAAVPESDLRRTAGCYVHPLYGLNGEVLTDNAPRDHYHHHGAFWTWPHVGVHQADGSVVHYDLWTSNTALKQHFVRWLAKDVSDDTATIKVENGWFVGKPGDGVKIMSEQVEIIVHRVKSEENGLKTRAVDFRFLWKPTDKPVSLRGSEGKSYGGFTVRFRPFIPENERTKKNAEAKPGEINVITVPSGVTDRDLPETPLAWADYTSRFGDDERRTGAAIFVPKTHPDYPPTWLTRYYGALCVGWPGVHDRTFRPGEEIRLNYRVWIHDAPVSLERIKKAYDQF